MKGGPSEKAGRNMACKLPEDHPSPHLSNRNFLPEAITHLAHPVGTSVKAKKCRCIMGMQSTISMFCRCSRRLWVPRSTSHQWPQAASGLSGWLQTMAIVLSGRIKSCFSARSLAAARVCFEAGVQCASSTFKLLSNRCN